MDAGVQSEQERQRQARQSAEDQAQRIIADAETRAKELQLAAKEEQVQMRNEMEAELSRRRTELERIEERLQNRLDSAERRLEQTENRERNLNQREPTLAKRENQLEAVEQEWTAELQRVAQMTEDRGTDSYSWNVWRPPARQEMVRTIREVEAEATEEADRRAREIVTLAIERIASDHVSEYAVSSVDLPSDEMKGRIIGRQGRNIRAIEQAIGVDLVVDDTPEAIIISSFDPVRREVARMALEQAGGGWPHPSDPHRKGGGAGPARRSTASSWRPASRP